MLVTWLQKKRKKREETGREAGSQQLNGPSASSIQPLPNQPEEPGEFIQQEGGAKRNKKHRKSAPPVQASMFPSNRPAEQNGRADTGEGEGAGKKRKKKKRGSTGDIEEQDS